MGRAEDGKHAVGNAPGTKAQQQRGHSGSSPKDNKTAANHDHSGKHRK